MEWAEILVSAFVSSMVGLALWAVLPRGVVLTKEPRLKSAVGEPLFDTWEIRNASALPIRITSVATFSPGSFNEATGELEAKELPCVEGRSNGVGLSFDDETAEIRRFDMQVPWGQVVVDPGETLEAHIANNVTVKIQYRRSGATGISERRELTIHGYV